MALQLRPLRFEHTAALAPWLRLAGVHAELAQRLILVTGATQAEFAVLPGLEAGEGGALWRATKAQVLTAARAAAAQGLGALAQALEAVEALDLPPPSLTLGGRTFAWGSHTRVMGILNATPDSFSDGGLFLQIEAALAHGRAMIAAGAELVDVGGESTRPGAEDVPVEEELRRVVPVLEGLCHSGAVLSIDTSKPEVARAAVAAGASLVNDVTGLTSARMRAVVAETGVAACVMHMQGTPRTMQRAPHYDDVVGEVLEALSRAIAQAEADGIPRARLLVDPGIGFGKSQAHNLFLLQNLHQFRVLGCPLLLGTSRKSFLGRLTGDRPAGERVVASAASAAIMAVQSGADVVRVHDVAETIDALAVADAVRAERDGGAAFAPR